MAGKKVQTIYRVVGPDNCGFYFSEGGYLVNRVDAIVGYKTGSYKEHHPKPQDDGIDEVPEGYKFGFQSLKSLKQWFTPDIIKAAASQKCKVQVWETEVDYHVGGRQVCFNEEKARLKNCHPLIKLIKHE